MKKDRIVITGMGAVTPVGIGVPAYWQSLVNGVGGVSQITRFDSSSLPVHIAAEVKDFDATKFLPKKLVRKPIFLCILLWQQPRKHFGKAGAWTQWIRSGSAL